MAFLGGAFLAIWTDITGLDEQEYDAWLVHEHMPERLAIDGFLRGRRYVNSAAVADRYFIVYEADNLSTLTGQQYVGMLNNPTSWTRQVMPHMHHFVRTGCRLVASQGKNISGAMATVRFNASVTSTEASASGLCAQLVSDRAIISAHLGVSEESVSSVPTLEKELRKGDVVEGAVASVLLLESSSLGSLKLRLADIKNLVKQYVSDAREIRIDTYELSYLLTEGIEPERPTPATT